MGSTAIARRAGIQIPTPIPPVAQTISRLQALTTRIVAAANGESRNALKVDRDSSVLVNPADTIFFFGFCRSSSLFSEKANTEPTNRGGP